MKKIRTRHTPKNGQFTDASQKSYSTWTRVCLKTGYQKQTALYMQNPQRRNNPTHSIFRCQETQGSSWVWYVASAIGVEWRNMKCACPLL
jgi:hypothetical protein